MAARSPTTRPAHVVVKCSNQEGVTLEVMLALLGPLTLATSRRTHGSALGDTMLARTCSCVIVAKAALAHLQWLDRLSQVNGCVCFVCCVHCVHCVFCVLCVVSAGSWDKGVCCVVPECSQSMQFPGNLFSLLVQSLQTNYGII